MKKMLILGASSFVGKTIIKEFNDLYDIYGTYYSSFSNLPKDKKFSLEIKEIKKLKEIIQLINPDIVISCLRGDYNNQLKFHRQLALQLQKTKSKLYYLSTANVFDGDYSKHHTELDTPISKSDYGNFKIECENMLKETLDKRSIIIRVPQIWGKKSPRLHKLKLSIKDNEIIEAYINLEYNNILDTVLAKQIRVIIEKELEGVFHLGSLDMISQGEFVKRVVHKLTNNKVEFRHKFYKEKEDTYYFGLKCTRTDFLDNIQFTNEDIISNITD